MSIWNFNTSDLKEMSLPFNIVNDLCKELAELSEERVIARVTVYEGTYRSYITASYQQMMTKMFSGATEFNVQKIMGDNATDDGYNNEFVYELFLTSKNTPKYKYRVFIMYYGIARYPVGLTLQEDIAKEIGVTSEGLQFKDESSFKEILEKILSSNTVGDVLRNLAVLNL